MALTKRQQADETLGQSKRADKEDEPANIRHAARRNRNRGRIGEENGGDGKDQIALIRPTASATFSPRREKGVAPSLVHGRGLG